MTIEIGGLFGILILIGDVYAVLNVVQSHKTLAVKATWIVAIILLPVAGLLAWALFGPRERQVA
ncbi:PLDc N-terminal domain-containing protein [Thalassolituus sp.]|jgi:heme/copper-type cytochrome/quinol oxidase subunit 2|uniref:PLDc N-terminal domain-containing protein n=1 Tax=Thalassolituus sp. TaxID=2030822 RepID=UPI0035159B5C|nr:MAG: hypothetical protein CSH36_01480 [Thalassolituus sp.]